MSVSPLTQSSRASAYQNRSYFSLLPSQIMSCQILPLKSALRSLHFTALTGAVVGAVQYSHPLLQPVATEKAIVLALRSHQTLSGFLPPSRVRDSRRGFQSSYLLNRNTLQLRSGRRKRDQINIISFKRLLLQLLCKCQLVAKGQTHKA